MRQWTSAKRCGLNRNVMCFLKPIGKCLLDARDKEGRQIGASMVGTSMFGASGLIDFSVYRTKRRGTLMYQAKRCRTCLNRTNKQRRSFEQLFETRSGNRRKRYCRVVTELGRSWETDNNNKSYPERALERDSGHPFGKCVAVHVRRSGCVRDIESHEEPNRLEGLCVPSKKYLETAKEFAKKYNLHSILLISDDLNVAEKCASNAEIACAFTPPPRNDCYTTPKTTSTTTYRVSKNEEEETYCGKIPVKTAPSLPL